MRVCVIACVRDCVCASACVLVWSDSSWLEPIPHCQPFGSKWYSSHQGDPSARAPQLPSIPALVWPWEQYNGNEHGQKRVCLENVTPVPLPDSLQFIFSPFNRAMLVFTLSLVPRMRRAFL